MNGSKHRTVLLVDFSEDNIHQRRGVAAAAIEDIQERNLF
jgi:hypothetical protein